MKDFISLSSEIILIAALVAFPGYPVEAAIKAGKEMLSTKRNEPILHAIGPRLNAEDATNRTA